MTIRGRSTYNPLSSSDRDEDISQQHSESNQVPLSAFRRATNRAERFSDDDDDHSKPSIELPPTSRKTTSLVDAMEDDESEPELSLEEGEAVTIVILDSAQKRFPIQVNPQWTIEEFKRVGEKTHKVPPSSQRLIFRGRMLPDSKTLQSLGITEDDMIVHLFPKPRVVVTNNKASEEASTATASTAEDQDESGAHVPQIVLDEEEQARRGQILVLGSYEIVEAQNNVRLLSLLLGTMCFMRLLGLISIATGGEPVESSSSTPVDWDTPPTDDAPGSTLPPTVEMREWANADYFDLLVTCVGLMVARAGLKATSENTSLLAMQYFLGTIVAGILWNIWNIFEFVVFVKEEKTEDDDAEIPLTNDDYRTIAILTIVLPMSVWFICCTRAWQFRTLIREAEIEAAQRIQSDLTLVTEDGQQGTSPSPEAAQAAEQEIPSIV
eukprot:Nitzschia sp. Nitz4//scaffold8_size234185//174353//175666//NITZ4_001283-RA/size234185-processed-gene-0.125-mRNA-1//1//CDS//3329559884//4308//frame0